MPVTVNDLTADNNNNNGPYMPVDFPTYTYSMYHPYGKVKPVFNELTGMHDPEMFPENVSYELYPCAYSNYHIHAKKALFKFEESDFYRYADGSRRKIKLIHTPSVTRRYEPAYASEDIDIFETYYFVDGESWSLVVDNEFARLKVKTHIQENLSRLGYMRPLYLNEIPESVLKKLPAGLYFKLKKDESRL
jgi:hypothetical protein